MKNIDIIISKQISKIVCCSDSLLIFIGIYDNKKINFDFFKFSKNFRI